VTPSTQPTPSAQRHAPIALTIALAVLGFVFVTIGVVYVTHTAAQLPSIFPGHQAGSAHHHIKHATAMFGLGIVSWIGAWLLSGQRSTQPTT
jgi:hypothetical protein